MNTMKRKINNSVELRELIKSNRHFNTFNKQGVFCLRMFRGRKVRFAVNNEFD